MNIFYKLVLFLTIMFSLSGCGSARMDMTKNKVSLSSPSIYSATFHFLDSKGIIKTKNMKGSVIKIDNKKIVSTMGFKRVFLDPGVHSIEMTWIASLPPVVLNKDKVSTAYQPLGYAPVSVSEYTPKRNFTMQLRVREGHDYFVNLQDSIINNNSYQLPKRLCISEVKKNSRSIKVSPGGNVVLNKPVKILACSK